jgi:regulator of replication initiation timing
MKTIAGLLSLALLLLPQVGSAFAQTSDYEIIDTFKKRSGSLHESLKTVENPAQLANLAQEVGRLESEYAPHRKLLADGLYPQTFDAVVAALRDETSRSTRRIALAEESQRDKARIEADTRTIGEISRQNEEYRVSVDQLTLKVSDMSARIEALTEENTGLLGKIKTLQLENRKDKESIAKLTALTDKLNANIRDRDALVLKMMDGLFKEYSKAELTDAQRKDLFVNAQGNDYVGAIVGTIDGNVKYADAGLLSAQDVQLVREQQRKLAVKWNEIKPLVAKLYQDEQARVRDIATVDTRVADWKKSLDQATWKSIHQVFAGKNMDIGPFSNAGEFHTRLVTYLDEQARSPSRDRYRAFRENVWDSPMKDQWLPVIPTEELTAAQRSDIDQRIAVWSENVSAIVRRWVLIALAGAALLVTAGVLLRRKKQPALPA